MLKKLYFNGWFDYKSFILDNQKKLALSSTESLILIHLLDIMKVSVIFDKENLKNKINARKDKFENSLANLLSKGLCEIYLLEKDGISYEAFNMDGFFEKCKDILDDTLKLDDDELESILKLVEKGLNKLLSGNEIEIVKSLVFDDRYTLDDFKLALKKLENRNVKNIKSLIFILNDLKKET